MSETISHTLELCAEQSGDITNQVYQTFFNQESGAAPLMDNSDDRMKGTMLAQTLELLMSDDHLGKDGYLRWEVRNHVLAYGVQVEMYRGFLEAIKDTVKASIRDLWGQAEESAWNSKIDTLLDEIYAEANA